MDVPNGSERVMTLIRRLLKEDVVCCPRGCFKDDWADCNFRIEYKFCSEGYDSPEDMMDDENNQYVEFVLPGFSARLHELTQPVLDAFEGVCSCNR